MNLLYHCNLNTMIFIKSNYLIIDKKYLNNLCLSRMLIIVNYNFYKAIIFILLNNPYFYNTSYSSNLLKNIYLLSNIIHKVKISQSKKQII